MVGLTLMRNPFRARSHSDGLPEDNNQLLKPSELPPKRLSSLNAEQPPGRAKQAPPRHGTPEEDDDDGVAHPAPSKKTPMTLKAALASTSGFMYKKLAFRQSPEKSEGDGHDHMPWNDSDSDDADGIFPNGTVVATKYGTALILEYRPDDRMYVVKTFWHATAYFNAETVVREVKCMIGDRVKTRWGLATVESYYLDDDMYGIALDWRWDDDHVWRMKATTKMFTPIGKTKSRAQLTKELMQKTAAVGYSSLRTSTSTLRSSTSSSYNSLVTRMSYSMSATTSSPKPQDDGPKHAVWTPFGEGRVLGIRASDGMAKVQLRSGPTAFLLATSLEPLGFGTTDHVATIFGDGYISDYRHTDTTYTVVLATSGATLYTQSLESLLKPSPSSTTAHATTNVTATSLFKSLPKVPFAAPKLFTSVSRKEKYAVGDRLKSQFGTVVVTEYRAEDDVFVCLMDATAAGVLYVSGSNMESMFPDALNPTKMTALLQMTVQATKSLQTTTVQSASVLQKTVMDKWEASQKKKPKFAVDDRVLCGVFGSGFVLDVHAETSVYHVKLRKLGIEGHFHEAALRPFPYDRATHVIVGEKHTSVPMEAYQAQHKKSRSEIIKSSMAANRQNKQHLPSLF
ncbi:hypothetical protein SPRG_12732 [Saprolegnia parasitica CBS 223.65]|uniref:Uncharacterized protein n=1 Tax=Saprolegnia parasitica (strain CBS 223.65) TaxID=695850 RepID=A0A067C7B9_SAPPC|nr:hypothetical protein SPRG_12732 [Saprolegnia parasitica CBS 223.65]KDO22451.1 hypothetical protein SPRG_12732 [Saprolegnia parasitica CBS 223.65]|eukprot:XP_012206839.1 hypothetical protein SPRG_12732 [Saprolegnia parasitica CBS 223.65]